MISIIIPIYNAEKFLAKCLDSILAQTYKNYEVICVDDCSTDNSLSILEQYAKQYSCIKVISHKKQKKQGAARNSGLNIAQGKYVTFIDADDYIDAELLAKMHKAAEIHFCDLVVTNVENIQYSSDIHSKELTEELTCKYKRREFDTGFYFYNFNFSKLRPGPVAKLYRRKIIEQNKIRFPENLVHEDVAFYWFYMPHVDNLYYINEPLYFRQIHNDSTMYRLTYKDENKYDILKIYKIVYKFLKKNKLFKLYKDNFYNWAIYIINNEKNSQKKMTYIFNLLLLAPGIFFKIYSCEILELKFLIRIIMERRKCVFWGASNFLDNFLRKYHINSKRILGIVDKDSTKWGKKLGNYEIFSPDKLSDMDAKSVIFSIQNYSAKIYPEVKVYLRKNHHNIKLEPCLFTNEREKKWEIEKITPQKIFQNIEFHVTEHCNLNCYGCDHFSPLAQPEFAEVSEFERDIKRISELTNGEVKRFCLLGGEPLLHPQIIDFMRITRQYLPETRIAILTNGILLPKQSKEFWESCKKYNIVVNTTKYPINIDFEKIKEIAAKYDVEYGYFSNSNQVIKTSDHYPLNLKGNGNKTENFKHCMLANHCIFLKHGHLYTCAIAPNIEHFNKYFNYNIPLTNKDGIDIYKVKNQKHILKFLATPIPFCKYCNISERIQGRNKWCISKKDISEWS